MITDGTFYTGRYGGLFSMPLDTSKGDRVLDFGGGYHAHPLATDVVDYTGDEANAQRHGRKISVENKTLHDGKAPGVFERFRDNEFDFVFTSHTLEHVDGLPATIDQMTRVGKRGFVVVPHYYMDAFTNCVDTGHKWFFDYDYNENVLLFRRREKHEFFPGLAGSMVNAFMHKDVQAHDVDPVGRAVWEIRFWWNDSIAYFEHDGIAGEVATARTRTVK